MGHAVSQQIQHYSSYKWQIPCHVRLQTHGDSGSPRAVVHQGQLSKSALVMVLKQQLLLISLRLGDLEVAAPNDVEVVAFLSFPTNSQQLLSLHTLSSCTGQM